MKRSLVLLSTILLVRPVLAGDEKEGTAPDKAWIEEVRVQLEESEDPFPSMPLGRPKLNHYAFLKYLRDVAADPSIDAVNLKLGSYGVGWARLLEIREGLKGLKAAGKKVFVYKENFSTPDLVLASVADRISIPESGMVEVPGVAIEDLYLKELLAKLHLSFDVVHIGEYKSAGESFVRDSMSKELRETLDPLLDEIYGSMVKAIAEGRNLTEDAVKGAVDQGLLTAAQAKAMGLVDRIEYEDQFKEGLKAAFAGKTLMLKDRFKKKELEFNASNPFALIAVMMGSLFDKPAEPKGPKVAIIYCSGAITSGKSEYDFSGNIAAMGSKTIVDAIDAARKDADVKAIVLRVNSPGGSALASDMIWRAIENAKATKPVIASMGDVAASGGYYISCNAHVILAEPQTITGSIGVVGMMLNLDQLFPWIGVKPERLTRGKRADLLTSKGLSDDNREMIRGLMLAVYEQFKGKVAAGRGKAPADIEPIARGRVWTGRDALAKGLVDQLGGLNDAVTLACQKGGLTGKEGEGYHVVEYPKRKGPLEFLEQMFGGDEDAASASLAAMAAQVPELRRVLAQIHAMRAVARDRICVAHPELNGFATPFASR